MIEKGDVINVMAMDHDNSGFESGIILQTHNDKRKASRILNDYFDMMRVAILDGKTWNIEKFGKLRVKSVNTKIEQLKPAGKFYKNSGLNKKMYNKRTPGKHYEIVFESPFMIKHKARFRASFITRLQLNQILLREGGKRYD